jgi:CheY-like chemotaxis protein
MDQRMPVMNGIEATNEILKIDHSALIIFVSADETITDETVTAGAAGFLVKPIREADLRTALRVHLEDKYGKDVAVVKS